MHSSSSLLISGDSPSMGGWLSGTGGMSETDKNEKTPQKQETEKLGGGGG